ncbi:MAG: lactate utilization protein C [Chloroflexota bacterium]
MTRADARAEVLRRIQDALGDAAPGVEIPRAYRRTTPPELEIAELFAEHVADYRATVHRTTADRLAATIATALARRGARRIARPPGLPDAWLALATVEPVGDEPPLSVEELDALDGTVTGCALAIAETGTIVLDGGPGQGRRVLSLLPDYHLCVVNADQVVGSVPEAVARLDPRRPMTWISGPSATSDIELERVEGVHGPRTLDVVLVSG